MIVFGSYLASIRTQRSGVIPYTIKDGIIYYLLAKHTIYKEYGDFGGGVKKFESSLAGSLRELSEESRGIFGNINPNSVVNNIAILKDDKEFNMSILFMPVSHKWLKECDRFYTSKYCDEISDILWIDSKGFEQMINNTSKYNFWSKIRQFLKIFYNENFEKNLIVIGEYVVV